MKGLMGNRSGFTLVELLIVVIILGVLAAVAIPQFTSNTEDAKIAALDTSLAEMRNAVELYYHQHNAVYPGAKKHTDGSNVASATEAAAAFVAQMTLYSAADGTTSNTKTTTHKYGPYLKKGLPANPFTSGQSDLLCDIATADISVAASSGTEAWKFYVKTGRLIANDGGHDTH
ncbi:MAG: type II secretion system protein [Candidatus Eisenbacteria bacterium]|uniref:Type II secretion system protein n=1 Tax=Eiseniibacteriota bacterium TaxID=2212470 RepID=A0A937X678_UNCEI|nr:type II secretion system protein [Candidatus Eisenbacteria bacterium]